ncbi:hypothetical protein BDV28DRAFT_149409 [Aspergillus coremiiformis]|uniref:Hydrophobic surface binding protein A-domain-containing protein n=1 Tax=Aspergillus coremiiformis TaxID=138285 RepID=A0A5N6Z3P1_9EURO|nr:hypothetical protein BDV28DRAFT_149409 [Aspergillus coremiiformis]
MHFFKYLVFAAPLALATPSPSPVASPAPHITGGLFSELPLVIEALQHLFNPHTLEDLDTIVKGGAVLLGGDAPKNLQKLLSNQNIAKLQHVIDNAESLLTPKFVNETAVLVGGIAPLVDGISRLLDGLLPPI